MGEIKVVLNNFFLKRTIDINKLSLKSLILNITISIKCSIYTFLLVNYFLGIFYFYLLHDPGTFKYNFLETLIHTFIATLTLSIPVYIKDSLFPGSGYGLDFLVLFHMFFAYLYIGILISMIYRKLTRT
jgi:hypothetical protein